MSGRERVAAESVEIETSPDRPEPEVERSIDASSGSELFEALYKELVERAAGYVRHLPYNHALHPSALVHEVYIKLRRAGNITWNNPAHFCAIAVKAMREVITDRLRRKLASKRRGRLIRQDVAATLSGRSEPFDISIEDSLDLDKAMDRLEREFPEHAQLVLLRFFGGFTMDEIANLAGKSRRTIERRWQFARNWLQTEMKSLKSPP